MAKHLLHRPPLVELVLAGQVRKTVQPEHGVVAEHVDDVPERSGVLVEDRADAEDAGVPGSLTDRSVTVTATCETAGMVPEMATMVVLCLMWLC